ncbi:MAG: Acetyl esterase/lipase [Bradyrhizobium sp.]|nr:Acetyl esterase/lipase [Bradyrhizobium sp.]
MAYTLDLEVAAAFAAMAGEGPPPKRAERGDWQTARTLGTAVWEKWASEAPSYPDVEATSYFITGQDGAQMELRWYSKKGSAPGSAVIYAHGGGMILGNLDVYGFVVSEYVSRSGVPFLAVEYRVAPESKGTMLAEDIFAGVAWLAEHAAELGVDPARIGVMGDSGGGGPAAGAAIIARDKGFALAQQLLIYPALDDRNIVPDPFIAPFSDWMYDLNFTGWTTLLGDARGTDAVSPISAPARLTKFEGLAPAYIECGELDIFRDESIAYAQGFAKVGIPMELLIYRGAPHGYDRFAPNAKLTKRSMDDRVRVLQSI